MCPYYLVVLLVKVPRYLTWPLLGLDWHVNIQYSGSKIDILG